MKPMSFDEVTKTLQYTDEKGESRPLPVFSDGEQCISCWELTIDDLIEINLTKRIFVGVSSGQSQPPMFVSAEYPFEYDEGDNDL